MFKRKITLTVKKREYMCKAILDQAAQLTSKISKGSMRPVVPMTVKSRAPGLVQSKPLGINAPDCVPVTAPDIEVIVATPDALAVVVAPDALVVVAAPDALAVVIAPDVLVVTAQQPEIVNDVLSTSSP